MGDQGLDAFEPTVMFEDNQSAICLAKNPSNHSRAKHVDIKYHFIREAIEKKEIELRYCPTDEMVADVLTKGIPWQKFEQLHTLMGVKNKDAKWKGTLFLDNKDTHQVGVLNYCLLIGIMWFASLYETYFRLHGPLWSYDCGRILVIGLSAVLFRLRKETWNVLLWYCRVSCVISIY